MLLFKRSNIEINGCCYDDYNVELTINGNFICKGTLEECLEKAGIEYYDHGDRREIPTEYIPSDFTDRISGVECHSTGFQEYNVLDEREGIEGWDNEFEDDFGNIIYV